jgi:signal transduction histidine kinase
MDDSLPDVAGGSAPPASGKAGSAHDCANDSMARIAATDGSSRLRHFVGADSLSDPSTNDLLHSVAAREKVQEEERSRIARDLHDALQQPLSAIKMSVSTLREDLAIDRPTVLSLLAGIDRLADLAIESTRRIVSDLRPNDLEELGLVLALDLLVRDFDRRSGISCDYVVRGDADHASIDVPATAACLYRVAQEALNNVTKHSRSASANVRLGIETNGCVVLRVSDDGVGIPSTDERKASSFGLLGMRERVRAVGGSLRIDGRSGVGTCVEVSIPPPTPIS